MSVNLDSDYDKIYRYCYFKVRQKEIAEDLTQETFLKYYSQKREEKNEKTLAYLYTIARHNCIDFFRKKTVERLQEDPICEDVFEPVVNHLVLSQALEQLEPDISEMILLRFASDFTMKEISAAFGISRFIVYRKINAGLKQLKQILQEDFSKK